VIGTPYIELAPVRVKSEDASSQLVYDVREYNMEIPYYQNVDVMQGVADYIVAQKKEVSPSYEVELINNTSSELCQILSRQISDRITLQSVEFNIDDDFFIEKIRHEINPVAKTHKCVWTVGRAADEAFWILGTSQLGAGYIFSTRLGY
jgi:hypothetical protein